MSLLQLQYCTVKFYSYQNWASALRKQCCIMNLTHHDPTANLCHYVQSVPNCDCFVRAKSTNLVPSKTKTDTIHLRVNLSLLINNMSQNTLPKMIIAKHQAPYPASLNYVCLITMNPHLNQPRYFQ
jgi:hypothetical protein